jgi:sporulation protein YlmC with PRC-barrel domain
MTIMGTRQLVGMVVVSKDGHKIGEVQEFDVNTQTWSVVTLAIRLERDVLEQLKLKKPLFGTQLLPISIDCVEGVADQVVLNCELLDLM